jgi:transposase InsO family protein
MSSGVQPIRLPPRSPNLNAYAERFVQSIKAECFDRVVLWLPETLYALRRLRLQAIPNGLNSSCPSSLPCCIRFSS